MALTTKLGLVCFLIAILAPVPSVSWGQAGSGQEPTPKANKHHQKSHGPGKEIGQGGASIGKGAAKGTADLAKGTAGAGGNVVTGHPVSAGTSLGKGLGRGGKDVGIGTAKGVAKISKGLGGEIKKGVKRNKAKPRDNTE